MYRVLNLLYSMVELAVYIAVYIAVIVRSSSKRCSSVLQSSARFFQKLEGRILEDRAKGKRTASVRLTGLRDSARLCTYLSIRLAIWEQYKRQLINA